MFWLVEILPDREWRERSEIADDSESVLCYELVLLDAEVVLQSSSMIVLVM
jgi:hypothetical protein